MSSSDQTSAKTILRKQGGQIVLEYVLLLAIGVSLALMLTSALVSRSQERPGLLVAKWYSMITVIGADTADDLKPADLP